MTDDNIAKRCGHFDALYRDNPDPWQAEHSWYERRKRDILLASLPRESYANAFEPGCGNGVTTRALAARCGRLLAMDCSAQAIARCRRLAASPDDPDLEFRVGHVPQHWPEAPEGPFDLIVVSELAYYLDAPALARLRECCLASLAAGGDLVLCHWLPNFDDRTLDTAQVHAAFAQVPGLVNLVSHAEPTFRLDVWRRKASA
ncbi:class I SAM-dependent methyltransferase [Verticiella sediminum]|uniref:Class I SAM-dependent methyltransferase n=1 Tax=Verticiella sediminum TaxID=1247510 RepID=A0A556APN3_9BURK|nr:class I SAM-dependent methyltransferase [Verticiella sediminum]TSH94830.1 class I SAM-dependent methyltransferase [Verticiella sediminum]